MLATCVWGATFLVIHIAVQYSGPWFFVGFRFITAALISALLFSRVLSGLTIKEVAAGTAIGVMIFLGYGLQTVGLQSLNSSTSAFITALYVPLVPLLQWVVFRKRPRLATWFGVLLAFVGLILLANPGNVGFRFGAGEVATIISTLPIAAEIILIGWFAGKVNLGRVTVVQLLVAGLLGFLAMPIAGEQTSRVLVGMDFRCRGPGRSQLCHPAGHELGPALDIPGKSHDHLRRRAGVGGGYWQIRRGQVAASGHSWCGLHHCRFACERASAAAPHAGPGPRECAAGIGSGLTGRRQ
ncbi:DMT family transporter [Glutamicibacter halophytocola]|uniref:DMT family transporter n=1 Tax=Glutamicibacter halophytocola TaxID=1933880 RepID=UPI003D2C6CD5